jgi:excisionase family DNA binding protein
MRGSEGERSMMEKLTCTVKEACGALSLGRSKLYELIKAGEIDTVKIGTRTLVKVASLLRLVEINSEPTSVPTFRVGNRRTLPDASGRR